MKNNPETRFQEFSEAWNTALIEDCFIERKERSGEGEMISVTINTGIRKAKELDRTVHIGDTSNYKVVRQGDIAYNSMRMWQGASGYSPYDGILSPAYTVIIPKQDIISEFFASLFKQPELIHTFELNSQGLTSDTWNLKFEKLKKITVSYPSSPEEQHKIAQFFSRLDSLITAEDKKLERLKTIKTASLEKMFPKQGETVPEVRFKGFVGNWEYRALKDITIEFQYGINASAKSFDGKNKYLRITDINDDLRVFNTTNLTSPESQDVESYVLHTGDIVFARTGASVGKTYLYNPNDGRVVYAGYLIRAKLNNTVCHQFILYATLTRRFSDYIRLTSQRSGQPGVNTKEYGEYVFQIPANKKEQVCIAEYFSRMDSLISAQEQKCTKLRSLKKSFLEKMFVSTPK